MVLPQSFDWIKYNGSGDILQESGCKKILAGGALS